jgi:hypothetical protein
MYCRRVGDSGKWPSASSFEFLCATECVCKDLFSIERLALCLELTLGRSIWCSVPRSPIWFEAWLCG